MKIFISYVYFKSPSSDYNLQYFIQNEIKYNKDIFYSIIINGRECSFDIPKLSNVNIIYRDNIGFDFGGHLVSLKIVDINKYDFFFFMNSGVIGPILKNKHEDWYSTFTKKINKKVKLVGTTIVCLPHTDLGGFGPKVERFFFCLDRQGLNLIIEDGTIFFYHKTKKDAILNGEYALSKCILKNGFTIDCMLSKYQNINWYNEKNYYINQNLHPSRKNTYFGKSIDPFEVIFHKWYWHNKSYVSLETIEQYTGIKFCITKKKKKILVTYVYFENKRSLFNLNYFLKNGVFDNDNVQYNFIIKGNNCSIIFPTYKNIFKFFMKNIGYDFGGYSYSIQNINLVQFSHFVFLNDTVIGPFIPRYIKKQDWYHYFISLLDNKTKLVGPTINRKTIINIDEHVQSMAFATDLIGVRLLIKENIFNLERSINVLKYSKREYIKQFEIGMSGVFKKNGYKIASFTQVDNCKKIPNHGDIHFENLYFGTTINPIECMFIKNNRINDIILRNYIKWNS